MTREKTQAIAEKAIQNRENKQFESNICRRYLASIDYDVNRISLEDVVRFYKEKHVSFRTGLPAYIFIRNISVLDLNVPASRFDDPNEKKRILDACDLKQDLAELELTENYDQEMAVFKHIAEGNRSEIESRGEVVREYYLRMTELLYPEFKHEEA